MILKIKIELSTGKMIELTNEEWEELKMQIHPTLQIIPVYPVNPYWPRWPEYPYWTYDKVTCLSGTGGQKMKNNIQLEEKEERRMATFIISTDLLAELLHLPENHKIIGSEWDWVSNSPRLFVEGPDLPIVSEGELISFITPTLTVKNNEDGPRDFIFNWNIDK